MFFPLFTYKITTLVASHLAIIFCVKRLKYRPVESALKIVVDNSGEYPVFAREIQRTKKRLRGLGAR